MNRKVSTTQEVLAALPTAQHSVRRDIAGRIAAGEEIASGTHEKVTNSLFSLMMNMDSSETAAEADTESPRSKAKLRPRKSAA